MLTGGNAWLGVIVDDGDDDTLGGLSCPSGQVAQYDVEGRVFVV